MCQLSLQLQSDLDIRTNMECWGSGEISDPIPLSAPSPHVFVISVCKTKELAFRFPEKGKSLFSSRQFSLEELFGILVLMELIKILLT